MGLCLYSYYSNGVSFIHSFIDRPTLPINIVCVSRLFNIHLCCQSKVCNSKWICAVILNIRAAEAGDFVSTDEHDYPRSKCSTKLSREGDRKRVSQFQKISPKTNWRTNSSVSTAHRYESAKLSKTWRHSGELAAVRPSIWTTPGDLATESYTGLLYDDWWMYVACGTEANHLPIARHCRECRLIVPCLIISDVQNLIRTFNINR